jgi:hypothetical protein
VHGFDFFPNTHHLEVAVELRGDGQQGAAESATRGQ